MSITNNKQGEEIITSASNQPNYSLESTSGTVLLFISLRMTLLIRVIYSMKAEGPLIMGTVKSNVISFYRK
jgi:hypothetical protein